MKIGTHQQHSSISLLHANTFYFPLLSPNSLPSINPHSLLLLLNHPHHETLTHPSHLKKIIDIYKSIKYPPLISSIYLCRCVSITRSLTNPPNPPPSPSQDVLQDHVGTPCFALLCGNHYSVRSRQCSMSNPAILDPGHLQYLLPPGDHRCGDPLLHLY